MRALKSLGDSGVSSIGNSKSRVTVPREAPYDWRIPRRRSRAGDNVVYVRFVSAAAYENRGDFHIV